MNYFLNNPFLLLALVFLVCLLIVFYPKLRKSKNKKKENKTEKKDNIKTFEEIFGFHPEDKSIPYNKKGNMILEKLEILKDKFSLSFEGQLEVINKINLLSKNGNIPETEILNLIYEGKYKILEQVDYGLGFQRLEELRNFINIIILEKKSLFWKANDLAKYFEFKSFESIKKDNHKIRESN